MDESAPLRPAVFLDRDGTLIEDRGYLRDPDGIELFSWTVSVLQRLAERFELLLVTNQSGVGRGLQTLAEVEAVNAALLARLAEEGIRFRGVHVCPHAPEAGCDCRKPHPALLPRLAARYGLDPARSFIVGDHPSDVEAGRGCGVRGIYVLTGHGQKHRAELPAGTVVVPTLEEAAARMLA